MSTRRYRLQAFLRAGALAFVLAWLFLPPLQAWIPFWVPFAILAGAEIEFAVRAWRERSTPPAEHAARRRAPGADDADLGWGHIVEDEHGLRYVPAPARAPRSRVRATVTTASVACAAALFVLALRVEQSRSWQSLPDEVQARVEARLSREAAAIANRPVTVRCDDGYSFTGVGSDALGVAFIPRRLAYLHPTICRTLHDVLYDDARVSDAVGEAVLVLAHEAVHLAGERDEAITECRALQEGVALGERLGLTAAHARRLMAGRYGDDLAARDLARLEYRLPAGCRDGGALDLRPGDSTFP